MARVKGGTVSKTRRRKVLKQAKDILEVNIDYIKLHKNKFSIVELMHIEIDVLKNVISVNYGLHVLMPLVVKMKLVILSSLMD